MRALLAVFLIASVGCVHTPGYPTASIAKARAAAASSYETDADPGEPIPPISPPRNVLVLSGGGMYGAYTSGIMAGWTETGARPEFDVVTGVSTGSLAGLAAFMGPKYDVIAREFYTTVNAADIYSFRSWVLLPWADSIASSKPLKKLINSVVDESLLTIVAREHRRGRRFYVGTTQLESRKFVVWDMGAIASKGGPEAVERFRDVMLASSSVPGMMPPVRITSEINGRTVSELHVDGGTTAGLFVPKGLLVTAPDGKPSGTNVYVIVAGKLYADPGKVRTRVLPVMATSANSLIYASCRAEIATIHALARLAGANFHLQAVPSSDRAAPDGLEFNPKEMTRLYEVGYVQGVSGPEWMSAPPFESRRQRPDPGVE